MHFHHIAPPDYLREHVRYFWTLEGSGSKGSTVKIIADGCPGLFFQQGGYEIFRDESLKLWPQLLLYGQTTQPAAAYAGGPFRALGACLEPSALMAVFGLRADTCLDLDALPAAPAPCLAERLLNTSALAEQLEMLADYLAAGLAKNRARVEDGMRQSVATIVISGGRASLQQLQQDVGMSERNFQRRFRECVGVPPKVFSRICQFQASLRQLRTRQYAKLSDIAFERNYADQSHYIRTFKEFVGFSPRHYQRQASGLLDSEPVLLP